MFDEIRDDQYLSEKTILHHHRLISTIIKITGNTRVIFLPDIDILMLKNMRSDKKSGTTTW
ncbi:MAG TPA: hypothetical protein VIK72_10080 [Clostridiaceae bacterium]